MIDWSMPRSASNGGGHDPRRRGTSATPIVRVPGPLSDMVKPVLDCGAFGVAFPQIATRAEAEATVRMVRYAPRGRRGYGPTYADCAGACRRSSI